MFQLSHYIFNCFRRFSDATKKAHPLSEDVLINIPTNPYSEPIEKLLSTFSRDFFQFSQLFQGTFFEFSNFFKGLFSISSTFSREFPDKVSIFPRDFSFSFRTSRFYSLSIASVQSKKYWSSSSIWSPLLPQFRKSLWKHRYKSESSAL